MQAGQASPLLPREEESDLIMDISDTTQPRSDQMNHDDVVFAPLTVTVSEVRRGSDDQPVELHLAEYPGRPFKPSKTVRRVLIAAWGKEADAYVGRRLTLVSDPTVTWGGSAVGGIRVSQMSDLEKPLTIPLTISRGKRKNVTVTPLPAAAPTRDWEAELELAGDDLDALEALGMAAKAANAQPHILGMIRLAYQKAKGN